MQLARLKGIFGLPEGALEECLLVFKVICFRLRQVDHPPLARVLVITVHEHVGPSNNNPTLFPQLKTVVGVL